jgi:RNA polymerase sigma-70 factor (ECF subfamily)
MDFPEAVRAAFLAGRSAFPGVALEEPSFREWLQAGAVGPEALAAAGADLYLACACTAGDGAAVAVFEKSFLGRLNSNVGRVSLTPEQVDELRQELRLRLIATPETGIGTYRGSASLLTWVNVCAVRMAMRLKGKASRRSDDASVLDDLVARDANPELLAAKAEHRETFRAALHECFTGLPARERTLLKMHLLDGMSIDEIGVLLRVHRATVARWLVAIRQRVLEQLCAKLVVSLGASPSEMRSLVRLVRSDVHLSVGRILGEDPPARDENGG